MLTEAKSEFGNLAKCFSSGNNPASAATLLNTSNSTMYWSENPCVALYAVAAVLPKFFEVRVGEIV